MDTIKPLRITFDPAKNEANVRKRGLSFSLVANEFYWSGAWIVEDVRKDYDERRYKALGDMGTRLDAVVYTPRSNATHVISLRKANRREEKLYAAQAES